MRVAWRVGNEVSAWSECGSGGSGGRECAERGGWGMSVLRLVDGVLWDCRRRKGLCLEGPLLVFAVFDFDFLCFEEGGIAPTNECYNKVDG